MEISSIFNNYRNLMSPEYFDMILIDINQFIFFITFSFRFAILFYCGKLLYKNFKNSWSYLSMSRRVAAIMAFIHYILLTLLSCYWYRLILIGVFKQVGIIKVNDKK